MLIAVAAASLPALLAYNVSPSPTFLNQALALAAWGAWVAALAPAWPGRALAPLLAALALVAAAAAGSSVWGGLPSSLSLSAIGMLAAAAVLAAGGAGARRRPGAEDTFAAFSWGWVAAGVACVLIAMVQVFWPDLPDNTWIARSGLPGRAVGNLRQPNHLASLLLWSCIAVVALLELRRLGRRAAAVLGAVLVFALVLTASRTGLMSMLVLALWGLLDRRLSRPARAGLLAAPLVYALGWLAMAQWAALSEHTFGGARRLAEGDISSSRFAIWSNTLALIREQPWLGVGFGEFNFAWTLSPFPGRPVAFFDHTHNLPLQLAVELGLPLAALVMVLLLWALWRGARQAWAAAGDAGSPQRCAVMMVLMIGVHSLLEYPLWYSYFLLPAAWAWGYALQGDDDAAAVAPPARGLGWAALALIVCTGWAVADYTRVTSIFTAAEGAPPLARRIAQGQRSVLFSHHADYAAVTSGVLQADPATAFDRTTHYLLDTRLMAAWARALAGRGETDAARHVAARLREFHKPEAAAFFEACPDSAAAGDSDEGIESPPPPPTTPAASAAPFQCEPPAAALPWRSFLPQPD